MNDQQIEKEIVEEGETAPRVALRYIESIIPEEHFFTAYDGTRAVNTGVGGSWIAHKSTDLLTFCALVLKNDFTVTGESVRAGSESFDAEVGQKIVRQNTIGKIWMLEGYLLKQRLNEQQLLQEPLLTEWFW